MANKRGADEKLRAGKIHEKFCAFLKDVSLSEDIDRNHVRIGRAYGRNNAFLGWSSGPYQEAIEAVKTACPKASEKTIAKTLSSSAIRLFEKHAVSDDADPELEAHFESILPILGEVAIREEIDRLLSLLESQVQLWTVFIPVGGLEIKQESFKIGSVSFYRTSSSTLIADISKLNLKREREEQFQKPFTDAGSYAVIEIEGESEFVKTQALRLVQRAVHILNLCFASCQHRVTGYTKIGIAGQSLQTERSALGITYQQTEQEIQPYSYSFNVEPSSGLRYEISETKLEKLEEKGLIAIIEYFENDSPNPKSLASRIQRAVTWHSKGINADNIDEQFVALAIALESLLVSDEGINPKVGWGGITQQLAERVAFLLGHDYESRVNLERRVKGLYGMRSKIVHEGQTASHENLILFNRVVENSIWAFASRRFTSWDDFLDWTSRQKFSTGAKAEG